MMKFSKINTIEHYWICRRIWRRSVCGEVFLHGYESCLSGQYRAWRQQGHLNSSDETGISGTPVLMMGWTEICVQGVYLINGYLHRLGRWDSKYVAAVLSHRQFLWNKAKMVGTLHTTDSISLQMSVPKTQTQKHFVFIGIQRLFCDVVATCSSLQITRPSFPFFQSSAVWKLGFVGDHSAKMQAKLYPTGSTGKIHTPRKQVIWNDLLDVITGMTREESSKEEDGNTREHNGFIPAGLSNGLLVSDGSAENKQDTGGVLDNRNGNTDDENFRKAHQADWHNLGHGDQLVIPTARSQSRSLKATLVSQISLQDGGIGLPSSPSTSCLSFSRETTRNSLDSRIRSAALGDITVGHENPTDRTTNVYSGSYCRSPHIKSNFKVRQYSRSRSTPILKSASGKSTRTWQTMSASNLATTACALVIPNTVTLTFQPEETKDNNPAKALRRPASSSCSTRRETKVSLPPRPKTVHSTRVSSSRNIFSGSSSRLNLAKSANSVSRKYGHVALTDNCWVAKVSESRGRQSPDSSGKLQSAEGCPIQIKSFQKEPGPEPVQQACEHKTENIAKFRSKSAVSFRRNVSLFVLVVVPSLVGVPLGRFFFGCLNQPCTEGPRTCDS